MDESSAFVPGALALVLQVSRVMGIAPLRFVKQRGGWRIRISPCLSVYGCVLVTLINLITIATMVGEFLEEPGRAIRMRTPTRRAVWLLDTTILMTLAFLGASTAPTGMRSMIHCLNHLQKINNELNTTHWPRRSEIKKSILFVLWSLITIGLTVADHRLVTMIISEQYGDHASSTLCIMYFFYYICFWIMQLQIFQFMLITLHIRQSFIAVNDKLRNLVQVGVMMSDPNTMPFKSPMIKKTLQTKRKSLNTVIDSLAFVGMLKPVYDQKSRPAHETVRRLALTYVSICDVVRKVDQWHGLVLLLLLSSFLLHMIVSPYYLIDNIFRNKIKQNVLNIAVQIVWCMLHVINLLMVIEPCHLTNEEMNITQTQISQLTRYSSIYEPLSTELDLFYRHILLNQVSFSPLKVTTLTRGLVATILGSITTYLVIIIQI